MSKDDCGVTVRTELRELAQRADELQAQLDAARMEEVRERLAEAPVEWISRGDRSVVWLIDPACGWCGRLLADWERWADRGWAVGLLPHVELGPESRDRLLGAWCGEDRALAMVMVHEDREGLTHGRPCDAGSAAIEAGAELARLSGKSGTPALVWESGHITMGFMEPPAEAPAPGQP